MATMHPHHLLLWTVLVLGVLVWQGVQSLQTRTVPVWRILLTPAIFIALGVLRVVSSLHVGPQGAIAWILAAAAGAPLALKYAPRIIGIDARRGLLTRAGSPVPLVRNLVVFTLQAGSSALAAIPGAATWRLVLSCAISGLSAGYFLCWVLLALRRFLNAGATPSAHVQAPRGGRAR